MIRSSSKPTHHSLLASQTQTVLAHLRRTGSITSVEAESCHKVRHLPARIFELRKAGFDVVSHTKRDVTGQRYVRYELVG